MVALAGGTLSVPGEYIAMIDKLPHRHRKAIDPSFVITHRVPLEHVPEAYGKFEKKEDDCIKVVLQPG